MFRRIVNFVLAAAAVLPLASLAQAQAVPEIKLGYACIGPERQARLSQISHEAAEICNLQPDAHAAYVGRSAFAHKGGMHVAGMQADPRTFEHIDPTVVGNSRTVLVSELSGKGTVREKAAEFGVDLDPAGVDRALLVVDVKSGTPADAAGLFVGDLLLSLDGQSLSSPDELLDLLVGERVGKSIAARVLRGGVVTDLAVTAGER